MEHKIFFCSKCDNNLIQYQILHVSLQDFICMECSACHKNVSKRPKCQYFDIPARASETVPDGFGGYSRTRDKSYTYSKVGLLEEIWMKRGVSFFLSARSRMVSNQPCLLEPIYCFMNIKMKSYIINVGASFRHANHSAAFVCGRLLRFHISKFHQITVTCCILTHDLVNTFFLAISSHNHRFIKVRGWLVVLRINVDLAIFQPYLDLEAGDNQSLKIQVARPEIEPRSSCSASQELNHSATAAPTKR